MKKIASNQGRKYYLWVTGPDYYLDENGNERKELEPGIEDKEKGWWSCHKATKPGDLIMMYRSRLKKDIKYVMRATTEAQVDPEWGYICWYQTLYKFEKSLPIGQMRIHPKLKDWNVLKTNFVKGAREIKPEDWKSLSEWAKQKNPTYPEFM